MHRTTEQAALELLRATQEIHAERHGPQTFTRGTHLPLEEGGTTRRHQSGASALPRRHSGVGVRGRHRVGHERAIRQGKQALCHHPAWPRDAAGIRLGNPARRSALRSLDWSANEVGRPMRCRQFACCRSGKRRSTHVAPVATYPSRGVGLHTRRPREATTSLAIPEVLQQGEGRISQPFRTGHQSRRNSAFKGGVRDSLHRGRPYGPRARKRRPGHLRMPFCPGTYWRRQKLGSYLRKPCLQHPRGRTPLPRPKRWRVPGARASLESLWRPPQAGQDFAPFSGSGNETSHRHNPGRLRQELLFLGNAGLSLNGLLRASAPFTTLVPLTLDLQFLRSVLSCISIIILGKSPQRVGISSFEKRRRRLWKLDYLGHRHFLSLTLFAA